MKPVNARERVVWTVVTVVLLAALAFFTFSPRLLAGTTEEETQAYVANIEKALTYIRDNYVDADKAQPKPLYEGALKGMFDALGDPYSAFQTSAEWRKTSDVTVGSFGGVGLIITKKENVGAEVVSPIEDSPAYKAGISAGDIIIRVNGDPVDKKAIDDIVGLLRGDPKTTVTVTIQRGESIVFDTTITRDTIEVPTVKRTMIPAGVGYLRIIEFSAKTAERCREAIRFFKDNKYASLVIDLRSNPGGLLSSSVDVANLFFDEGLIVEQRSERSPDQNYRYMARKNRMLVDPKIPIVVLVDRGSASASEILSGALRDSHRAVLYGEKTYGKGSVQTVMPFGDGGFRLTTARYYLPSGVTIDKVGIEPDRPIAEPALTEAEQKSLNDILNGTFVPDFVKAHPAPTEAQVNEFIAGMRAKGNVLNDRSFRILVRNEVNSKLNSPPLYDLDLDLVLQAAVKDLQGGEPAAKK